VRKLLREENYKTVLANEELMQSLFVLFQIEQ